MSLTAGARDGVEPRFIDVYMEGTEVQIQSIQKSYVTTTRQKS
jgi:hypothetical protein